MFKASVTPDQDVLSAIADNMLKAPILMQTQFALVARRVDDEVIAKLRVEPPPPKYPLVWTSAKQRRAFFATNGFGKGIPYRRTHDLANNWRTVFIATPTGGEMAVVNSAPESDYVQGEKQQIMHQITGWVYAPDVIVEAEMMATDLLIDAWYDVAERIALGGTR